MKLYRYLILTLLIYKYKSIILIYKLYIIKLNKSIHNISRFYLIKYNKVD